MTTGNFILKMLNYKRKFKSDLPRQKQICRSEIADTCSTNTPPPPSTRPFNVTTPLIQRTKKSVQSDLRHSTQQREQICKTGSAGGG